MATLTIHGTPEAAALTSTWIAALKKTGTVLSTPTTDYGSFTFDLSALPKGARIEKAAFSCQVGAHVGSYTIAGSSGSEKEVSIPESAIAAGQLVIRLSYKGAYRGNEVGADLPGNHYSSVCRFSGGVLTVEYTASSSGGGGSDAPQPESNGPLLHIVSPGRLGKAIMYYPPGQTDFSRNGRALRPIEAMVEEEDNGNFSVTLTLPMDQEGAWQQIVYRGLLRIPAPERKILADGEMQLAQQDQIFRIHEIETDLEKGEMRIEARHIFYDLSKAILTGSAARMENVPLSTALSRLNSAADHPLPFSYATDCEGQITGDYQGKNVAEALLDPETGIIAQLAAHLSRDNFDIYIIQDTAVDRGVRIQHGRNCIGATCAYNTDAMGNRIVARMDDAYSIHDDPKRGEGEEILSVFRSYDAQRGTAASQAEAEFEEGLRGAELTLDVDFVLLSDTADFPRYAGLQKLILGDMASISLPQGRFSAVMTGYIYNPLTIRYEEMHVGPTSAQRAKGSVPGYRLGSVPSEKLEGQIKGDQIKDGTLTVNKISSEFGKELDITSNVAINLIADAMEGMEGQVSRALIRVDGVEAAITMKAEKGAVDELGARLSQAEIKIDGANAAIDLKASLAEVDEISERLSQAEVNINGLDAEIKLIATQSSIEELVKRVSQAEIDIDGANARIEQKASQTVVDEQGERISSAELRIDGAESEILAQADYITLYGERLDLAAQDILVLSDRYNAIASAIDLRAEGEGGYVSVRLDSVEQTLRAKADTILLEGYVKADELETEILTVLGGASIPYLDVSSLYVGNVEAGSFSADSINVESCALGYVNADSMIVGGQSFSGHSHVVTVNSDGTITLGEVSSTGGSFNIADTAFYKDGVSAAMESVTLTAGGWLNGSNIVSASNGKSVRVGLPAFSTGGGTSWANNKTTVFFYTASVGGYLASREVDASSIYTNGQTDGRNGVTLSEGTWSGNKKTITASNGKSITVDASSIYDEGYAAGVAAAKANINIRGSNSITNNAPGYYTATCVVYVDVLGEMSASQSFTRTQHFSS